MTYLNVTHPELKANYGKSNADPQPNYLYVTAPPLRGAEEVPMLLAGDMTVMLQREHDYDVPTMLVEMFKHKWGVCKGSDQERLQTLLKPIPEYAETYVKATAMELEELLLDNWDKVIENFWIADAFYNAFNRIPRLMRYLDNPDTAYKILGKDVSRIDEIRADILNPEKSFDTCKNLGVNDLDD